MGEYILRMNICDFSKITACGECCVGCKKKEVGFCKGFIESNGNCKEWEQSGGCPIYKCAMKVLLYYFKKENFVNAK